MRKKEKIDSKKLVTEIEDNNYHELRGKKNNSKVKENNKGD